MWSTVGLAVSWYCLAVSNQLLAAQLDLDYFLIPWCVLASSLLVYGLSWLHPLLPRGWKLAPSSPVPRVKNRTVAQFAEEGATNDSDAGMTLSDAGETADNGAAESVPLLSSSSPTSEPVTCGSVSSTQQGSDAQWRASSLSSLCSLSGFQFDANSADNVLLGAAAVCNVFYHASSLFVGLWIGDSSIVLIWRSLEPLLLHVIHSKQLTLPDALQGGMLLYLLARWDTPTESNITTWLMQRGLIVLGSSALCCCNHLLHSRCQSGELVGRSFFPRVAGYSLLLSVALWGVFLPVVPLQSLVPRRWVRLPAAESCPPRCISSWAGCC